MPSQLAKLVNAGIARRKIRNWQKKFWDAGRVLLQSMTKLNHLISSYANYISWQKKKIFLSDLMMKVLKDTLIKDLGHCRNAG
jgi:hypothetical protein